MQAGGNLIAIRPDPQLAGLLGLAPSGSPMSNEYLKVDTTSGPGAGIVGQTIQYHGAADRYTLSGAQAIATLYSDATSATANPAVTMRSVGTNGGHAAAFTYDLARSVVYTRQGNPGLVGRRARQLGGGSQRSAPTTSSSAPRPGTCSPTGSISTRSRSPRPTSSSTC